MSGENGAERVKNYSVPMAEGLTYNYAAKAVDAKVLEAIKKLAEEAQLSEKFEALYNGEMVNTGEKRLVLHQLCRVNPANNTFFKVLTYSFPCPFRNGCPSCVFKG